MVEADILAQIGPAVNSSKSFLIYGQPGNGKTALAESLFRVETEPIYMPYAIECQGNIIQLYDPIYHQKIDDERFEVAPRFRSTCLTTAAGSSAGARSSSPAAS